MGFGCPGSFRNLHTGSLQSGASSSLSMWVGPCVHTDTRAHTHVCTCASRVCTGWSHWKGSVAPRAWGSALEGVGQLGVHATALGTCPTPWGAMRPCCAHSVWFGVRSSATVGRTRGWLFLNHATSLLVTWISANMWCGNSAELCWWSLVSGSRCLGLPWIRGSSFKLATWALWGRKQRGCEHR